MEEGCLVWWTARCMCVVYIRGTDGSRMHYGKKASRWRKCCSLDNVLLHGKPWVTLLHVTLITYLEIIWDIFMALLFPDGSGLLQQDNALCHTAKIVQECLEEHEFKVFPWPPNSPDLNPTEHLWDVLEHQIWSIEASLRNLQDLQLMSWYQRPQDTIRGLVESMLRCIRAVWKHEGDLLGRWI